MITEEMRPSRNSLLLMIVVYCENGHSYTFWQNFHFSLEWKILREGLCIYFRNILQRNSILLIRTKQQSKYQMIKSIFSNALVWQDFQMKKYHLKVYIFLCTMCSTKICHYQKVHWKCKKIILQLQCVTKYFGKSWF